MYLSDRDLKFAVETVQLIVDPKPEEYDTTSIDLHLGSSRFLVGNFHSLSSMQVRIFSWKYASSR